MKEPCWNDHPPCWFVPAGSGRDWLIQWASCNDLVLMDAIFDAKDAMTVLQILNRITGLNIAPSEPVDASCKRFIQVLDKRCHAHRDKRALTQNAVLNAYPFAPATYRQMVRWLLKADEQSASKAILRAALGISGPPDLPLSTEAFSSCRMLMNTIPELWDALPVICDNQPVLGTLFDHWDAMTEACQRFTLNRDPAPLLKVVSAMLVEWNTEASTIPA